MRTGRIVLSLLLFLLLVFPWAFAQSPSAKIEVFVEGGTSFSNSGSGTEIIRNPVLPCPTSGCQPLSVSMTGSFPETIRPTAGARYRFTRHSALEASYSYSLYHFVAQPTIGTAQSPLAGYNRNDLVSFNYVASLPLKAHMQPFLTVGLGTNRFSGPSNAPAVVNGYVKADNGWQFAWNYGAGADVALQRHFAVRMELRDYITAQPAIIRGNSHDLVPSVGVVFRFK